MRLHHFGRSPSNREHGTHYQDSRKTRGNDEKAAAAAKDEMDALVLFKTDMSTYHRAYTFLSQVFNYANTDLEKRAIFYKHLIRLLKFGQEHDEVDLSQVVLTHHTLKDRGKQTMRLAGDEYPKLDPMSEIGSGALVEKQKAFLSEIII